LASLTAVAARGERRLIHRSAMVGCAGVAAVFGVFALFPPAGLRALALVSLVATIIAALGSWTLIPQLFALLARLSPRGTDVRSPHRSPLRGSIRVSRRHGWVAALLTLLLLLPSVVAGLGVLRDPGTTLPPETFTTPETVRMQLAADTERLLRGTVEF